MISFVQPSVCPFVKLSYATRYFKSRHFDRLLINTTCVSYGFSQMNIVYGHTLYFFVNYPVSTFIILATQYLKSSNLDQLLIYYACVSYSFSHLIKLSGPVQPTSFSLSKLQIFSQIVQHLVNFFSQRMNFKVFANKLLCGQYSLFCYFVMISCYVTPGFTCTAAKVLLLACAPETKNL